MFAVIAGLLFAIPFAGLVAAILGGDSDPDPVLWHEMHALAGIGFALALFELRRRYLGWFTAFGRIALSLAVASALGFAAANVGAVLGTPAFSVPSGIALVALSGALLAVAATTRSLPRPLPLLLAMLGIAPPAMLGLGVIPPPMGIAVTGAALMGYGLLWTAFGFVQLSRNP